MPKKKPEKLVDVSQYGSIKTEKPETLKFAAPKIVPVKRKINGNDAIINISVETNRGKVDLEFLVISFCGNVSASKQSRDGLHYMFKEIFIKEFGGTIK